MGGQRPFPTPKGRKMIAVAPVAQSCRKSVDQRAPTTVSAAGEPLDDVSNWTCPQRTLVNTSACKRCEACDSANPNAQDDSKQATSGSRSKHSNDAKSVLSKSSGGFTSSAASALSAL